MKHRALLITLLGCVGLTWGLLWGTTIPLGVPGEWTWPRTPDGPDVFFGLVIALVIGAVYVAIAVWGSRQIQSAGRVGRIGWLALLTVCGFVWLWTVQESASAPTNLEKVPYTIYYPRSSGYYTQAKSDVTTAGAFLAGYENLLAKRDYLHIGTHPPGLTLCYAGLMQWCDGSPGLTEFVLATVPASATDSLATIRALAAGRGRPLSNADEAALWLASLLTMAAVAMTCLGIYVLIRRYDSPVTAWTLAALWPLVPAVAVFHPKSDVLFPLLAVGATVCWTRSCDRRSLIWAIAAGFVLWLALMLSLAFITIAALLVVMTLWEWFAPRQRSTPDVDDEPVWTADQQLLLLTAGACGFLVPSLWMFWRFDINLFNVWRWNLSNHALFYDHNVRTWWKWLLVNPVELALGVGLPIAALALLSMRQLRQNGEFAARRASLPIALVCVWGLLWLSGKNMGEAARLWVLLMPWVVMTMATSVERMVAASVDSGDADEPTWYASPIAWLMTAQMIVCVLTVLRIDGFHFSEFLTPDGNP
ncbi:MAG: hypothetical protein KDA93_05295 [Planctomycetaceae bacterium]|nr:hypothetical protein [Planctomycetaceae bacterium]